MSVTSNDPSLASRRYLEESAARRDPDDLYDSLLVGDKVHPIAEGLWFAAGYSQLRAALKDPRFSRQVAADEELSFLTEAPSAEARAMGQCMHANVFYMDPPEHTHIHKLFKQPFLPTGVKRWDPYVLEVVNDCAASLPRGQVFDLKAEYALPISQRVICAILGVPHEDHLLWEPWGATMIHSGILRSEKDRAVFVDTFVDFGRYIADLLADRRVNPGDDLLTEVVQTVVDGKLPTDRELIGNFMALVIAGHETTANTICSAVGLLMEHREQWEKLVADPSLALGAVEEALRLQGAQRYTVAREALEDIQFGDTVVPKGDRVIFLLEAGNRDPAVFENPLAFDITRNQPNLAFGGGHHLCLGIHLARIEMAHALRVLAETLPNLRLAIEPSELEMEDLPQIRGWTSVPVYSD